VSTVVRELGDESKVPTTLGENATPCRKPEAAASFE